MESGHHLFDHMASIQATRLWRYSYSLNTGSCLSSYKLESSCYFWSTDHIFRWVDPSMQVIANSLLMQCLAQHVNNTVSSSISLHTYAVHCPVKHKAILKCSILIRSIHQLTWNTSANKTSSFMFFYAFNNRLHDYTSIDRWVLIVLSCELEFQFFQWLHWLIRSCMVTLLLLMPHRASSCIAKDATMKNAIFKPSPLT